MMLQTRESHRRKMAVSRLWILVGFVGATVIVLNTLQTPQKFNGAGTDLLKPAEPHHPSTLTVNPKDGRLKVASLLPDSCSALEDSNTINAFDEIYKEGSWGVKSLQLGAFYNDANWPPKNRKSASGHGSDPGVATVISLRIIKEAIAQYNITTMIDMPCGDVNWILDSWVTDSLTLYLGLDIAKEVIAVNQQRFGHHSNKLFRHWDGASCPLPKWQPLGEKQSSPALATFELVHMRDVVQHVPLDVGIKLFCNIFQSGAKVLVSTTYIGSSSNINIAHGEWYGNNLEKAPFNFPGKGDAGVKCELTHPGIEMDSTCIYDLMLPWVQEFIHINKCSMYYPLRDTN